MFKHHLCLALSVLALDITPVLASCHVRARVAVVHNPVATAVIAPAFVAVNIPLYGAGYTPTAQQADGRLDDIIKELRALRQEVNALKGGNAAQPAPGAAQTAVQAIFANKCAACHDQADGAKDGGGVVLTLNKLVKPDLDAKIVSKSLSRAYTAKMPPPNNKKSIPALSDAEVAALMEWGESVK